MRARVAELEILYDEIYSHFSTRDPQLVRRRVVPNVLASRVMLVGQALGRDTQRLSGLPYCFPHPDRPTLSRGGRTLERFLRTFGYTIDPSGDRQYAYHTDLTHYFPGRSTKGAGDIKPSAEEIARNWMWFEREIRLVRPLIVVALGQQAASSLLSRFAERSIKRLIDVVATPIHCIVYGHEVQLIAVHHPSGAFQHPASHEVYERAGKAIRGMVES